MQSMLRNVNFMKFDGPVIVNSGPYLNKDVNRLNLLTSLALQIAIQCDDAH